MKKIILSILIFLISPVIVFAEVNYDITDYYIESHIKENGDLEVKELFVLEGTFNGYERDIVYANSSLSFDDEIDYSNSYIYNASGISDLTIKAKYVDKVDFSAMNEDDFTNFSSAHNAYNGDSGIYVKSLISNGERLRMYYPSNGDRVAFYITYTIMDAVVIHQDVAELYWNFIGSDYADQLNNLNIKVYLPNKDMTDNFRIWAHGGLTGEINYIEENNQKIGALATMKKNEAYTAVDIRMTFDKNLIKDTTTLDQTNEDALTKIIEVETKRADVANALRKELKLKYYGLITSVITYYLALIIAFIYVVKKYGLDKKSDFKYDYNREFIDDYNVEVVDYLINKKNISSNAMSASIMNLIYKKNIKAEEFLEKNKKEYTFTLLNENNINDTEKKLIDFLFVKIGNNKTETEKKFTTIQLKKYASSPQTYNRFINSYTAWKTSVTLDGKAQGFYEKTGKSKLIGVIFLIISIIISLLASNWGVDFSLTYLAPVAGIIFFVYTLINTQKSTKGASHYAKWMAFKRFLVDFGTFNEKELPEITLWERYLVYAVVFGIADKVQKAMNVKIKELELTSNYAYPNINLYNINICDSITKSVDESIRKSYERQAANQAAAASRSSSGSGFGGGFSSGGGFGGGGGGGRGF